MFPLQSIKLKTVEYVVELRNTLSDEENEIIKINSEIPVNREIYNHESPSFKVIFPRSKYLANFINM